MVKHLANSEEMITFAPDDKPQKRLMACHRVFFGAIYSKTGRLERSLIRNPQNPQSPKLPLYKESCQFFQSYEKSRAEQKKFISFLYRDGVASTLRTAKLLKKHLSEVMAAFSRRP